MFQTADSLISFYNLAGIVILIFARMVAFISLIPVFSGRNVPNLTKIGLALIISYSIVFTGKIAYVPDLTSFFSFFIIVAKEAAVGLIMGYVVFLFFSIFYFAGQLMDYQMGFSMLNVFDPLSQIEVPVTGNILYMMMTVLLIINGGLNMLLFAFLYSYQLVPIGFANLTGNENLIMELINFLTVYFAYGVRIASPIVGTLIIVDFSLGILVKAVPQMNVFVVGVPLKLFIGLIIFMLIMPTYVIVQEDIFNHFINGLYSVMKGMGVQ